MFRSRCLLAAGSLAFVAACGDKAEFGVILAPVAATTVRFVNATNLSIGISNGGLVVSPNTGLGFGLTTTCLTLNAANALAFTNAGTGATLAFNPAFSGGGSFTVIAFTDATGATKFAVLNNNFNASSGQSAVRIFNAASGQALLTFANNGTTLGSNIAFGTASDFVAVASGADDITFLGTGGSLILDPGSINLSPQTSTTIVIAPVGGTLHAISVPGC
jgi:hypothetical protein